MYDLVGVNGNAYSVMGYTARAMKEQGFERAEIKGMQKKAMSGDYDNLLCVCMEYIDMCNERAAV